MYAACGSKIRSPHTSRSAADYQCDSDIRPRATAITRVVYDHRRCVMDTGSKLILGSEFVTKNVGMRIETIHDSAYYYRKV